MKKYLIYIIIIGVAAVATISLGVVGFLNKDNEEDNKNNDKTEEVTPEGKDYTKNDEVINKEPEYILNVDSVFTKNDEKTHRYKETSILGELVKGSIEEGDILRTLSEDGRIIEFIVTSVERPSDSIDYLEIKTNTLENITLQDKAKITKDIIPNKDYYSETKILASCNLYSTNDGGRSTPIFSKYNAKTVIDKKEYDMRIYFYDKENIQPGETSDVDITIKQTLSLNSETKFPIKQGNKEEGMCTVKYAKGFVYRIENDSYIVN